MKRVGVFSFGDSKPKRQQTAAPSKVLHVRGLPTWCSEHELTDIVAPFGNVVECLIIQDRQQAFIELESIDVAQDVLTNLEFSNPSIRSKPIFFQFSSRQKVEKKNRVQNYGGAVESHPGAAPGFPPAGMLGGMGPGSMGPGSMGPGSMGPGSMGPGSESGPIGLKDVATSPILLLSITKVDVQVTVENIHQVCSPFGEVLRIVTFDKNNMKQALVEFASIECAANAKHFLEGKDMFQNCCHIRTAYSNRTKLTVKQNNHRMRDFTIEDQRQHPSDLNMPLPFGSNPGMLGMQPHTQMSSGMPSGLGRNMANPSYGGAMGKMGGLGPMGGGMGGMRGMGGMPGLPVLGGMPGNPMHMGGHRGMDMMGGASPVVLVSKLQPEKISPDSLFTLFGVYGDVQRVKILYSKRDTALIQYATPEQASLAINYLNGCDLFGSRIVVVQSKHPQVKLARQQDQSNDEKELTKDFSGSDMHRYKKGFVNRKNIFAPSRVLHVSNLHESATEQELRNLFSAQQPMAQREPVVEFFKTNRKMAYVAMDTVENGINALINIHGYKVGGWPIRVSFSPKDPNSVRSSEPDNSRSSEPVHSRTSEPVHSRTSEPVHSEHPKHPEHPKLSMHSEHSELAEPEPSEHEHSAHLLMH